MDNMIHKFEKAGLGKAPFKFVLVQSLPSKTLLDRNPESYNNQLRSLVKSTSGNVGGCCEYCGMPITECYLIKSSDGNTFFVGCDCVAKTGDAGLVKIANEAKNKLIKAKRHAKEEAEHEEIKTLLHDKANRDYLDSLPHPKGFSNLTFMDYVTWMYDHSGASGRGKLLKTLKDALAGK